MSRELSQNLIRWITVYNGDTEPVEPFGLMAVIGMTPTGQMIVTRPFLSSQTGLLINGPGEIGPGEGGQGHCSWPAIVAYDDGGNDNLIPMPGQTWGSVGVDDPTFLNRWKLQNNQTGFYICGNAGNGVVMASGVSQQTAWVKVTSLTSTTITLFDGTQVNAFAAVMESSYSGGTTELPYLTWNDGQAVWFIEANYATPPTGWRYQCRLIGQDINGIPIWSTSLLPLQWVRVASSTRYTVPLANGGTILCYGCTTGVYYVSTPDGSGWVDGATLAWVTEVNNATLRPSWRYQCRLVGQALSRTVVDAVVVQGSLVLTSASANFAFIDTGDLLSGAGIAPGTTIAVVNSSTSVTMSVAATGSFDPGTVTIQGKDIWATADQPLAYATVTSSDSVEVVLDDNTTMTCWPCVVGLSYINGEWVDGTQLAWWVEVNGATPSVGMRYQCRVIDRSKTWTVDDAVLVNGETTLMSASANFAAQDVGDSVVGVGIAPGTTIAAVNSTTQVTMSVAAIASVSPGLVTREGMFIWGTVIDRSGEWVQVTSTDPSTVYLGTNITADLALSSDVLTLVSGSLTSANVGQTLIGTGIPGRTLLDADFVIGKKTLSSLSANFTSLDVGQPIVGSAPIPNGTTIASITSSTAAVMSAAATATANNVQVNIGNPTTIVSVTPANPPTIPNTTAVMSAAALATETNEVVLVTTGYCAGYAAVIVTPEEAVCSWMDGLDVWFMEVNGRTPNLDERYQCRQLVPPGVDADGVQIWATRFSGCDTFTIGPFPIGGGECNPATGTIEQPTDYYICVPDGQICQAYVTTEPWICLGQSPPPPPPPPPTPPPPVNVGTLLCASSCSNGAAILYSTTLSYETDRCGNFAGISLSPCVAPPPNSPPIAAGTFICGVSCLNGVISTQSCTLYYVTNYCGDVVDIYTVSPPPPPAPPPAPPPPPPADIFFFGSDW